MTTESASVYRAIDLKKTYDDGQVQALRGVDFTITSGEFVAIIGPSGCGKTTLLQMLGALDRPTAGDLLYRGDSAPATDRPRRLPGPRDWLHLSVVSPSPRPSPRRKTSRFRCLKPSVRAAKRRERAHAIC